MRSSRFAAPRFLLTAAVLLSLTARTFAIDTVTRRSSTKPAAGEVTSATAREVVVTPRIGEPVTVPANDVIDIIWDDAPPAMKLARSQEGSGQLELALKSYTQASAESPSSNDDLRGDIRFSIARVKAQGALADPVKQAEALQELKSFVHSHKNHFRFYAAQLLLGEFALAARDLDTAEAAFADLIAAPWPDYQLAGKVGSGRILFARGDVAGAKAAFDTVAAAPVTQPAEISRKLEAMLGQAKCLQAQAQHAEAVTILEDVVRQSSDSDTRLQAEAYVRQGASYAAIADQSKQAILAYLHVDVVPALAQYGDLHAEALYQLSQLWPAVGQPARAAETAARLGEQYPNSEWTKKLGGQ